MQSGSRSLLWYLLVGTRGGSNRFRILVELRTAPRNAHQLAQILNMDYRTIRHHLNLLEQNSLVHRPVGKGYGAPYELSPRLLSDFEAVSTLFDRGREIVRRRICERARDLPDNCLDGTCFGRGIEVRPYGPVSLRSVSGTALSDL